MTHKSSLIQKNNIDWGEIGRVALRVAKSSAFRIGIALSIIGTLAFLGGFLAAIVTGGNLIAIGTALGGGALGISSFLGIFYYDYYSKKSE